MDISALINVSAFYEAFLRTCALNTLMLNHTHFTRGKKFLRKTSFEVRDTCKKDRNKAGVRKLKNTAYYGMMPPSSLASNAMHLHP